MNKKILSHFEKSDPILYGLAIKVGALTLSKGEEPYLKLVESIINQQLSGKAADTIFGRLKKLFPKEVITPDEMLKIPDNTLRAQGISYPKIKYLKDLSSKVALGELQFEQFDTLDELGIITELTKVKGIGRWTAEMFMMFHLGREDVFSVGDLGLRRAVEKHYFKGKEIDLKKLEKMSKKWAPYRTYASMILWRSLDNR